MQCPLVQEADGGDVGHALGDGQVVGGEGLPIRGEQVQRAQHLAAQPERYCVAVAEPARQCPLREHRPPAAGVGQVHVGDHLPRGEAVQAGAFRSLELEELEQPGGLVGVGDDLQVAALVVEHQAGGVGVDQFHAALGEHLEELDDVEVLHQGVR